MSLVKQIKKVQVRELQDPYTRSSVLIPIVDTDRNYLTTRRVIKVHIAIDASSSGYCGFTGSKKRDKPARTTNMRTTVLRLMID